MRATLLLQFRQDKPSKSWKMEKLALIEKRAATDRDPATVAGTKEKPGS